MIMARYSMKPVHLTESVDRSSVDSIPDFPLAVTGIQIISSMLEELHTKPMEVHSRHNDRSCERHNQTVVPATTVQHPLSDKPPASRSTNR